MDRFCSLMWSVSISLRAKTLIVLVIFGPLMQPSQKSTSSTRALLLPSASSFSAGRTLSLPSVTSTLFCSMSASKPAARRRPPEMGRDLPRYAAGPSKLPAPPRRGSMPAASNIASSSS